ncbi:MAG: hypothetical protein JWN04_4536 [Myxococcaceae bacterium]|nr:hypothetical protein [Myxococcaceae bacterium]
MSRHAWGFALTIGILASACHKGPKDVEQNDPSAGAEQGGPVSCGSITCGEGQICCNPSCGICTAPDVMCTQQFCDTPEGSGDAAAPAVSCASVRCVAGTHCELVQVQCVRAPCNPVPECKPDAGGDGADGGT